MQLLYEWAVDEHVELFQQLTLFFVDEAFIDETCIAPDVLVAVGVDGPGKFGETLCLLHRVASGEGDIGEGVGHDDTHQLCCRHLVPAVEVPRLGIMAARTLMPTPSAIDGGPEPRTVHHRILYDVKYSNHS